MMTPSSTATAPPQAFGGVVFDRRGHVLLRRPTDCYGDYVWTFPKGGPHGNETAAAAALREVLEETGIVARIVAEIPGAFPGTSSSTTKFFVMEPTASIFEFRSETEAIAWVHPDHAPDWIALTTDERGRRRDLDVLAAALKTRAASRS